MEVVRVDNNLLYLGGGGGLDKEPPDLLIAIVFKNNILHQTHDTFLHGERSGVVPPIS